MPFKIEMFVNELSLATGTAFVYRVEKKNYLITNWHNVAGRRPHDFQPISRTGGIPTKLSMYVPTEPNPSEPGKAIAWRWTSIDLYKDTKNYAQPEWWEHPEHGPSVDLVAIEIDDIEITKIVAANDESLRLERFHIWSGMDVFILGYPQGISGGGGLPIWKRGSIASEPDVDMEKLPMFYIDTATRPGTSGSPVYAQASGFSPVEGKRFPDDAFFGTGYRFLGIYSGRIAVDCGNATATAPEKVEQLIYQAQLGKVWKEQAIIETICARKPGVSSWGLGPKKA